MNTKRFESIDEIVSIQDKELIGLLQTLVQIPSWVPDDEKGKEIQNENDLAKFIEGWLMEHTDLKVERLKLDYGRFNIIASKGRPDVIFLAHMDTVAPSVISRYGPFSGEIHNGKVWGRGSSDMKCGIAALMQAAEINKKANNYWIIFYADEEYDFLGMKAIVRDFSSLKPKYIISADGTDLEIGIGCRGLIEIRAQVQGVTSHATSADGKNAVMGVYSCVNTLREFLKQYEHPLMGISTLNLAYIIGGKDIGSLGVDNNGNLKSVGQEGNMVPDIAEFVIDIRPSSSEITTEKILSILKDSLQRDGLIMKNEKIRHNLGSWFTETGDILRFIEMINRLLGESETKFSDLKSSGYVDIQMLWEALGKPPSFVFGGGSRDKEHSDDENAEISQVMLTRDFFSKVLENQG